MTADTLTERLNALARNEICERYPLAGDLVREAASELARLYKLEADMRRVEVPEESTMCIVQNGVAYLPASYANALRSRLCAAVGAMNISIELAEAVIDGRATVKHAEQVIDTLRAAAGKDAHE